MAFEDSSARPGKMSRVAGEDLRNYQYCFVKLATGGDGDLVMHCNGATDIPIGILQNKPNSGQEAEIQYLGISKVIGSAALGIGDLVGTNNAGRADAKISGSDTTEYVMGIILLAPSANGNVGSIRMPAPHRAS